MRTGCASSLLAMYDPVIAGPAERKTAVEWMRRTLPAARTALIAADPELEPLLVPNP